MARDFDNRPESLLKEIREQYKYQMSMWEKIRKEARTDMRYVSGDPWDPVERAAREDPNFRRPCLSLDELGQYVNQLVNEVRQNKRAVRLAPVGNGANDKTAELRGGIIRHVEYKSNAQNAYATAFQGAVERSYGYCRISTRFVAPDSKDQELVIRPIPNPDSVLLDYDAKEADYSDGQRAFILDTYRKDVVAQRWTEAEIKDFGGEFQEVAPAWIKEDRILIAEYWRIENNKRDLMYLFDPQLGEVKAYLDEFKGAKIQKGQWSFDIQGQAVRGPATLIGADGTPTPILYTRKADWPMVVQYITNGVEILEKNPWSKVINGKLHGRWIPILACMGKEIYVDTGSGSERRIMSLIRLARDPYMLYCYYRTCQAELVGMTPKTPFVMADGQQEGREEDWQNINKRPLGYITYKPVVDTSAGTPQAFPPPQRPQYDPPIQSLELGAESARRAIQAAMGISALPTAAQRRSEKSGVALERIESQQARGSFHFIDNYDSMVAHGGRIMDDLLPIYYDGARDVGTRGLDEKPGKARINDAPGVEAEALSIDEGDHEVVIDTGPSFMDQRDQADDFVESLIQNLGKLPLAPPQMQEILALAIRLKNLGPIGEQIADTISPKQQEGDLPPQAQAALAAAKGENDALKEIITKLQQMIQAKLPELQTKIKVAEIQQDTAITVQGMKADLQRSIELLSQEVGSIETRLGHLHETEQQRAAQEHEREMADAQQGHEAGLQGAQAQAQQEQAAEAAKQKTDAT